jgi:hypothetical protein
MSKDGLECIITHEDWTHGKAEKEIAIGNPRGESSIGRRSRDSSYLEFDRSIRLFIRKNPALAWLLIAWIKIRWTYGIRQRGTNIGHRQS